MSGPGGLAARHIPLAGGGQYMAYAIAGFVPHELERTLLAHRLPRGDEFGVVEAHLCAGEIGATGVAGATDLGGLHYSVDEFWVKLAVWPHYDPICRPGAIPELPDPIGRAAWQVVDPFVDNVYPLLG